MNSRPKRRRQDEEITEAPNSGQVLPVAELGDDFNGDAEDGATYLALANREARSLPFYKRVEPPAAYIEIQRPFAKNSAIEVASDRHPALPRESWEVVNAAHFRAYKAQIAKHWPPSPPLECPYPSPPNIEDEEGWKAYIGGADEDGGDDEDGEEDAMDEEAAMNAPPKPARPRQAREPLVSLLAELDTDDQLLLLGYFNGWLGETETLSSLWARWIFALLCVLDSRLDSGQQSQLRDLVRTLAGVIMVRWEQAVERDELQPTAYKEGFYGVQTVATERPENGVGSEAGAKETPQWVLGARWKNDRDAAPRSEAPKRPPDDESVDAVLARAWVLISAVVAGWGQWDLVDEVNAQISALPRHS